MLRFAEENMLDHPWFRLVLCGALGLVLAGCPQGDDDDDSALTDDDVADDDTISFDEGCILVNGVEPGYANLADAVFVAQDGDNISLCTGIFEGSVTVDKSLSILGLDAEQTTVVGSVNEMAITVTASDVTLAHLSVESSRNGIVAEDVTGLVIDDVTVAASGQYGLSLKNTTATIEGCYFTQNPFGAIDAQGSDLTISSTQIVDNQGYGIRLVETSADIQGTQISNVAPSAEDDDFDGTCVYVEDSPDGVTMDTMVLDTCQLVAFYGFYSDLDIRDCSVSASNYGVVGIGGGGDGSVVADSYFEDIPYYGIYLIAQDAEVTGNTVTATNAIAGDSIGIAVGNDDGTFVVEDNLVEGYRLYSMWVQYPYDPEPSGGTAVVRGNTIRDGELYGLYISALDEVEFTDNTVDGLTWSGVQPVKYSYDTGMGMGLFDIEQLTMSGNVATNVDVVGMFLSGTEFESVGDEITDTKMWGSYITESAGTFTGLNAHDIAIYGIDIRGSDIDFADSTFTNVYGAVQPADWDDPEAYEYSSMALVYNAAQGRVESSSFTGIGYYGMYVTEGDLTISDNTFDDNYVGIYVYGTESASGYPLYIEDNTFGVHGYTSINAYVTDATISGNTFTDTTGYYGMYLSHFYGSVEDNTFDMPGTCVNMYSYDVSYMGETPAAFTDNTFTGCSQGIYTYYFVSDIEVTGNTFDSVGTGVQVSDSSSDGSESLTIVDNDFLSTTGKAIYVYDIPELEMSGDNFVMGTASEQGVRLSNIDVATIDSLRVSGASSAGLTIEGSGAYTVTDSRFTGCAASGIEIAGSGADVLLQGNTAVNDNGTNGISLSGAVTGDIIGNAIEGNEEYGIYCSSSSVLLGTCINAMSGNVLSDLFEENGCSMGCLSE